MIFVGVDPGATGAIAVICGATARVYDVPTVQVKRGRTHKTRVDVFQLHQMCARIATLSPDIVCIEDTWGITGQSAPAAFAFGQTCGYLEMAFIAVGMRVQRVSPQRWKADMRVTADKGTARRAAAAAFPAHADQFKRVKDDGRAEATLIALWAREQQLHGRGVRAGRLTRVI
jgi:crossover junction endodeoxyribonuclease RuvC